MDPNTLSSAVIAALSPLVAAGAVEVAKTAFKDTYTAIKIRLGKKPEGEKAIKEFEKNPKEGATLLQSELARHLETDEELVSMLKEALEKAEITVQGALVNKIEAEKVVVANKIDTVHM